MDPRERFRLPPGVTARIKDGNALILSGHFVDGSKKEYSGTALRFQASQPVGTDEKLTFSSSMVRDDGVESSPSNEGVGELLKHYLAPTP